MSNSMLLGSLGGDSCISIVYMLGIAVYSRINKIMPKKKIFAI